MFQYSAKYSALELKIRRAGRAFSSCVALFWPHRWCHALSSTQRLPSPKARITQDSANYTIRDLKDPTNPFLLSYKLINQIILGFSDFSKVMRPAEADLLTTHPNPRPVYFTLFNRDKNIIVKQGPKCMCDSSLRYLRGKNSCKPGQLLGCRTL